MTIKKSFQISDKKKVKIHFENQHRYQHELIKREKKSQI